MQANLGVEAQPPTPGGQNVTLYPYVNPQTELIDGTNLPSADVKVTPIADTKDGTQIWRFTHNGVDTHPIHFHLFDVQVLNRVTWDNIVMPPDANELGWKDTVRMSPLEDTIVALRPVVPKTPFEVPNSVRRLNPMMPDGSTAMFNNVDPQGNPVADIVNGLVNFGWEYVYPLPHPQPRGDGHDASGQPGAAAAQADGPGLDRSWARATTAGSG